MKFVCKLNVRSPWTLKFGEITALVRFSTATAVIIVNDPGRSAAITYDKAINEMVRRLDHPVVG